MKSWSTALFPLSILFVLCALTFWLRFATEFDEPKRDGKLRHDPDSIITDAVLRKINAAGKLQYTLKAAEVRHYPDDDTTHLSNPHLVYLSPAKPTLTVRADRGLAVSGGDQIDLLENVVITRAATPKRQEFNAAMAELTVFPDEEKGVTKSAILMTEGKSWVKGVGMKVDYKTQTYVLESQASALIESKRSSSKKLR